MCFGRLPVVLPRFAVHRSYEVLVSTCQVRVVRSYVSCRPPSAPPSRPPPHLNRKCGMAAFPAGPQTPQLRSAVFHARPQTPQNAVTNTTRKTATNTITNIQSQNITSTNTQPQHTHNQSTQPQTHKYSHNHNHTSTIHNHNTTTAHNHNTQPQSQHTTREPTNKVENHKTHDHGNMLLTRARRQMIEMSWWGSLEVE